MLGTGIERLANHNAGLGPTIGVLHAKDLRDDLAVARQLLVGVAELVGLVPDIHARAAHRVGARR